MPLCPMMLATQISQEVWNTGHADIILKEWEHSPYNRIHRFQFSEIFDAVTEVVTGHVKKEEMAVYPSPRAFRTRLIELMQDRRFSKITIISDKETEITKAMLRGKPSLSRSRDRFSLSKSCNDNDYLPTLGIPEIPSGPQNALHRSASEPAPIHSSILSQNTYPRPESPPQEEISNSLPIKEPESSFSFFQYLKRTLSL